MQALLYLLVSRRVQKETSKIYIFQIMRFDIQLSIFAYFNVLSKATICMLCGACYNCNSPDNFYILRL